MANMPQQSSFSKKIQSEIDGSDEGDGRMEGGEDGGKKEEGNNQLILQN